MALIVVRPGTCSTIQDRGRVGYRNFGVPLGGAFDRRSLDLANALLGNEPDAAAIELTMVGGTYRAESDLAIALAGAPMASSIRSPSGPEETLQIPQTANLRIGDELVIGGTSRGTRTYLAVLGGWRTRSILGSRSSEVRLKAGDVVPAREGWIPTRRIYPVEPKGPIRVVDGPDADRSAGDARVLESGLFRVSNLSDRMGLRLEGPPVAVEGRADRVSSPVAPGAVQVAGGRLIVLGVAGGTMGGYPHLAHVLTADLDQLAQLKPGDPLTFRRVEIVEARWIDRDDRRDRLRWRTGVGLIQ